MRSLPSRVGAVPRVLLLTDRTVVPPSRTLAATVGAAVAGGVDGVVVRERDLPDAERLAVASDLRTSAWLRPAPPVLIWAAPAPAAETQHTGTGLHLRAADSPPVARPALLGRSCHTAEDLRCAAQEGCDYVTLSPVAATPSKPGYGPPLGPDGLRALLESTAYLSAGAPRVLALGGVTPARVRGLMAAGAHGVAVLGAVMRAGDPRATSARLVEEVARWAA